MTASAKFRADVFGQVVEMQRKQLGWSRLKLAIVAGVNQTTITNIEVNKTVPHIQTMLNICEALKLDPVVFWQRSTD